MAAAAASNNAATPNTIEEEEEEEEEERRTWMLQSTAPSNGSVCATAGAPATGQFRASRLLRPRQSILGEYRVEAGTTDGEGGGSLQGGTGLLTSGILMEEALSGDSEMSGLANYDWMQSEISESEDEDGGGKGSGSGNGSGRAASERLDEAEEAWATRAGRRDEQLVEAVRRDPRRMGIAFDTCR